MRQKVCPRCRLPLPHAQTRCICGYVCNQRQIEEDGDYSKIHFQNRLYTKTSNKTSIQDSERYIEQFLPTYQKTLLQSTKMCIENLSLPSNQCINAVQTIWNSYNQVMKGKIRYESIGRKKQENKYPQNNQIQEQNQEESQEENNRKQSQEAVTQKQFKESVKQIKKHSPRNKIRQLKRYYRKQIQCLFVNQQKLLWYERNSVKLFLQYVKKQKQISSQYVKLVCRFYFQTLQRKKGYAKQQMVFSFLTQRGVQSLNGKQANKMLILAYDLLKKLGQQNIHKCQQIMLACKNSEIPILKLILQYFQSISIYCPNAIQSLLPTYKLIYAIIYIGLIKASMQISLIQVLGAVGHLQLQNQQLNEQNITVKEVRYKAHRLRQMLSISLLCYPMKWAQKYCLLFAMPEYVFQVATLNRTLCLECVKQAQAKRSPALEQDISAIAAVLIYLKISVSFEPYPYLVNCPASICKRLPIINSILERGIINGQNKEQMLPDAYRNMPNLHAIFGAMQKYRLTTIEYKSLVKCRSFSHIDKLSSKSLLKVFLAKRSKDSTVTLKIGPRVRSNIMGKRKKEENALEVIQDQSKDKEQLNKDLLKQIKIIQGEKKMIFDKPCESYELFAHYTQDTLEMANRPLLQCFMETMSEATCSYNQLSQWVVKYQRILLQYQDIKLIKNKSFK